MKSIGFSKYFIVLLSMIFVAGISIYAFAGSVDIPNTFTAGDTAKASEVNDNFSALETAVDDNDSKITTNTNNISDLANRSWEKSGNDLYYDVGNVGIGTTNPDAKLDVNGGIKANNSVYFPTTGPGSNGILTYGDEVNNNTGAENLRVNGNHHLALIIDEQNSGVGDLIVAKDSPWSPILFIVKNDGNVGIGTMNPEATLDINGYMKLSKNVSEPATCDATQDGSLALTSGYRMCVCDGTNWVFTSDGITSCSW